MTVFAVGSVHGAPGVTATVMGLAAAWPSASGRSPLVVEADPDGGVLASRFAGLRADQTLADVAVGARRTFDIDVVLRSARPVWGGVSVVVGPPSAEQTHTALGVGGDRLATGLAGADLDVLVDVGRLTTRSPCLPIARRAVVTLLVARPMFEDVAVLATRSAELGGYGCDVWLAVAGTGPYDPGEVAEVVGAPLLGVLPNDRRAASVLTGGPGTEGQLRRSGLWRALVDLAGRMAARPIPARRPSTTTPTTSPNGAHPEEARR